MGLRRQAGQYLFSGVLLRLSAPAHPIGIRPDPADQCWNWQFLLCFASIGVEQSPAVGLSASWSGRGANPQIASPFNAGGNSGNNSLGSSTTSIGTPDFTLGRVPLSKDVTVEPDGSLNLELTPG